MLKSSIKLKSATQKESLLQDTLRELELKINSLNTGIMPKRMMPKIQPVSSGGLRKKVSIQKRTSKKVTVAKKIKFKSSKPKKGIFKLNKSKLNKTQSVITISKVGQPKVSQEKSLLQDALKDLESELNSLALVRNQMEKKVNSASSQLGSTQRLELEMQNRINDLKGRENQLVKKIQATKEKLTEINKRMEKIKTAERQLEEI